MKTRTILYNALVLLAGFLPCGCSTISNGPHEDISVNTNPPGAVCAINRNGAKIAQISATPGETRITKTKDDITVLCTKPGYEDASYIDKSGIDDMVFGNIALGGLIGWGVDSATGSDNLYITPINITLNKK